MLHSKQDPFGFDEKDDDSTFLSMTFFANNLALISWYQLDSVGLNHHEEHSLVELLTAADNILMGKGLDDYADNPLY